MNLKKFIKLNNSTVSLPITGQYDNFSFSHKVLTVIC